MMMSNGSHRDNTGSFQVHTITSLPQLWLLEKEWNEALAHYTHTIYDTFWWNIEWLRSFDKLPYFFVIMIKRNGIVSSIAPFVILHHTLFFMGGEDGDFHAPLIDEQDWDIVFRELKRFSWARGYLMRMPYSAMLPLFPSMVRTGSSLRLTFEKEYRTDPAIFSWLTVQDDAIASECSRKIMRLERREKLWIKRVTGKEELKSYFNFIEQHFGTRAIKKNYSSPFARRNTLTLLENLRMQHPDSLAAFGIMHGGYMIAAECGFIEHGTYYSKFTAFDHAYYRYSPGVLRIPLLIETAKAHGIEMISWGAGDMLYKAPFATQVIRHASLVIHNSFLTRIYDTVRRMYGALHRPMRENCKHAFLFFACAMQLHKLFERLNNHRVRIVCYHKVKDFDTSPLSVSSPTWHQQLCYFQKNFNIMRLSNMKDMLVHKGAQTLDPHALAITIDDGYVNLYEVAFPLIKTLQIPVAIFVTGAPIHPAEPSWWNAQQEDLLTPEHMREMAASGLIEFYPHTMSHPILSKLSHQEARYEIVESKKFIENILGTPVDIFAYPSGGGGDFTHETENVVREAGFAMAVSVKHYPKRKGLNLMAVDRRVAVEEPWYIFRLRVSGALDWLKKMKRFFPV